MAAYKNAKKYLSQFRIDQSANADKLPEAKKAIDIASADVASFDAKKKYDMLYSKGQIYNYIATREAAVMVTQGDGYSAEGKDLTTPIVAQQAYQMALDIAEKNFQKNNAMGGLLECSNNLNLFGGALSKLGDNVNAYKAFNALLEVQNVLTANKYKDVPFQNEADYHQLMYATGFCANNAGLKDKAQKIYEDLKMKNFDDPGLYATLFDMYLEKDEAKALKVLEEGTTKYPGNKDLLYAEINYSIKSGKMDDLVGKLNKAIEMEPKNVSLYNTLGFVYDNLFQKADKAGDKEKAKMHFDNALKNYQKALSVDDENADAAYSIGALYYNKAALVSKQKKEVDDRPYSKENLRESQALESQIKQLFDEALPNFQRAESLNPNDRNILIALKELYAKRGSEKDLELSGEFKRRLEIVSGGGTVEKAYFENK